MSALTLKLKSRAGRFVLQDDDGVEVASGVARPSHVEGVVTLTFTQVHQPWTPGTPIRVPIDWRDALLLVNGDDT